MRTIDRHVSYHRYVGYLILFWSSKLATLLHKFHEISILKKSPKKRIVIHTLAHIYITEVLATVYDFRNNIVVSNLSTESSKDESKTLLYVLSRLPFDLNGSLVGGDYLNPIRSPDSILIIETFKMIAGSTGKVF